MSLITSGTDVHKIQWATYDANDLIAAKSLELNYPNWR